MHFSSVAYFSFVPLIIYFIIYIVIELLERFFHHFVKNKLKIYLIGAMVTSLLIIVLSLYVVI